MGRNKTGGLADSDRQDLELRKCARHGAQGTLAAKMELGEVTREMERRPHTRNDWSWFYRRRKVLLKRIQGLDPRYSTVGAKCGALGPYDRRRVAEAAESVERKRLLTELGG